MSGQTPTRPTGERTVLVGVTGGIAIYKAVELVRGLVGVAMDDLDEALIERPELSPLPETCRARDLLRSSLA